MAVELNPAERALEQRLGRHFHDPELLQLAITHRSWSQGAGRPDPLVPARAGVADDNERLEFLGDAVLGLRVSERLWEAFPGSSEGQLSRLRSWIVSARNLATVAQRLRLGEALRLSRAEESIGGRSKPRLLANALEAIIAAIHLDGGYPAASSFIDGQVLGADFERLSPVELHEFAYKSTLQEWAHSAGHASPIYEVVAASGPDHERVFRVRAEVPGVVAAEASAGSKKEAEQRAAGQVLVQLGLLGANGPIL